MNKEFLHMQKLAGLITESEYKQQLDEFLGITSALKTFFNKIIKQIKNPKEVLNSIEKYFGKDGDNRENILSKLKSNPSLQEVKGGIGEKIINILNKILGIKLQGIESDAQNVADDPNNKISESVAMSVALYSLMTTAILYIWREIKEMEKKKEKEEKNPNPNI
jgi:hypothetical protein